MVTPSNRGDLANDHSPTATRRDLLRAGALVPLALAVPMMLRASPPSAPASGASGRSTDPGITDLQRTLQSMVGGYDDPAERSVAALGLVTDPDLDWQGAAGYARRARPQVAQPDIDYQYRIGSATKTFTATVVLQLVGEGLVGLDDPVERHLPGVVPGQDRILVHHLLNMTSGLHDYVPLLFPSLYEGRPSCREYREVTSRPITPQELIRRATAQGLRFEPGSFFEYCTTNYLVLGLLVEQVTGHRFRDELRRRVLGPLSLRRTELPARPDLTPPYLHGYAHFEDRPEEWTDVTSRYEPGWAGGGMVATMTDLSRFLAALLAGQLLPPHLLTAMKTPSGAPSIGGTPPAGAPSGDSYGLGLHKTDTGPCGPLWGGGGDTHGYNNRMLATSDGRSRILAAATGFPSRVVEPGGPLGPFINAAARRMC
jgi:D-alanyl-D-alanine carboxypeptidase